RSRVAATLAGLARLARHPASGMYYNWYDPRTGEVLRAWPEDGSPVHPFLSSVDNGWLAAGLLVVEGAVPELRPQARALRTPMDFGFYYDPQGRGPDFPAGVIRGGFWDEQPPGCSVVGNHRGRGPDVFYTRHHYDNTVTETRIATYLGI